MLNFESDYNNGACPQVMLNLFKTNDDKSLTYGFDKWSKSAEIKIKQACNKPDANVFFLCGGTQTNAVVIDSLLHSYQGVICCKDAHINIHEAGAIEVCGHKVIALPSENGKLRYEDLKEFLYTFENDESRHHMVQPGMVYLTFPSEWGTVYSKKEIEDIYCLCKNYNLPLYIDGARLGYGLTSKECDFDLPWLSNHCDCFYIGGTKCGALCGEAVVFTHNNTPDNFFTIIKQHGALTAKSRLIGIQFDTLFTDNLYFEISKHANLMAEQLREILQKAGFTFYLHSPTNQQFVIMDKQMIKSLDDKIIFSKWLPVDKDNFICRFVTSWATSQEELNELQNILLCK